MYPFHDDLEKDVVLCATCVSQERKSNLALSSKKEDAFLSTGYSNWKKALQKFRTHESSNCHLEALTMSVIRETHEKSHCYGNSLQLAVGDMIKEVKNLKNALDTTSKIWKLLKRSPKPEALFKKFEEDLAPEFHGFS